jgi:hypothetical protein
MINVFVFNDHRTGYYHESYDDHVAQVRVTLASINTLEDCYRYGGAVIHSVVWVNMPDDPKCVDWFESRRRGPKR